MKDSEKDEFQEKYGKYLSEDLKQINEPYFIKYLIPFIARKKSLEPLSIAKILIENAKRAFKFI